MKPILFIIILLLPASGLLAQKFISGKNHISFYSKAPMEDIEAHTYSAKSIFDTATGEIVFTVPINTFQFKKSLMQEHFNEKYLESDKYPRAKFKGKVRDFQKTSGKQMVTADGTLEIHGVTREVSVKGEIDYSSQQVTITSKFPLRVADYKIRIPKIVAFNIAEVVDVNIEFIYSPYEVQ
jgi:polyisoprenoid-binding protein YceI